MIDVGDAWRAAAAVKIRSRARHEYAYSPTGWSASLSEEPPDAGAVSAYTLPVLNTAMRAPAKRSLASVGTPAFIAHVMAGFPVVPNFCPAMKTMFGAAGIVASDAASSRSAVSVS